MKTLIKRAGRFVLHDLRGLAALRYLRRREFAIMMFHGFQESDAEDLDAICAGVTRDFEPVSLSRISNALTGGSGLPDRALTVTVDDGYRNFLLYGHPIFQRHRIPVTLYAVSGFVGGRIWLWPDRIEYALEHTAHNSVVVVIGGERRDFPLLCAREKEEAFLVITEMLKNVPNQERIEFLIWFERECGVALPVHPPAHRSAMSWEELRRVAAEGVEIGCHTESHPILSRVPDAGELRREIVGAKAALEQELGRVVNHFCYPNGRVEDISSAAVECVRGAGFVSAVTCTAGLNPMRMDRFLLRRLSFDCSTPPEYGAEKLAGLHASPRTRL